MLRRTSSILTHLKRCKTQTHLHQVHAQIVHEGLEEDPYLISIFLSISSCLSYSASVFERIRRPSTILWNCLIKGYVEKDRLSETVSCFVRMKRAGGCDPDDYTYPLVIKVCASERELWIGSAMHGSTVRVGVVGSVFVGTSLVDFYGKCGDVLNAGKVFDEMRDRTVVTWTALVVGHLNVGDLEEAKKVFDKMPEKNVASWNAMMDAMVKAGDLGSARRMFDEISEKNAISYTTMIDGYAKSGDMASARVLFERADVDIVAWSALISGYVQNGQPSEALKVFVEMSSRNVKPDEFIMVSLMAACSQIGSLELAKWVDSCVSQSAIDVEGQHVKAALIDMNAKCGNMDRATELFEAMPKRDIVSYCSMMQGLAVHGRGDKAVCLFNKMLDEGLAPDEVAFTIILAACSHGGLVEEGLRYFESMQKDYLLNASSDHYACIVDLLSRSGRLRDAYDLIKSMPVELHASAWGALLGACSAHCNIEIGEIVANRLFEIEPLNAGSYVLLSNIYAALQRWFDVTLLRNRMEESGIKKICGRTWIS